MSEDLIATENTIIAKVTAMSMSMATAGTTLRGNLSNQSTTAAPSTDSNNLPPPLPEPLASLVVRLTLITIIFLFTVVGNALTIYVIKQNRALRSIKNYYYGYYLMNLSVSDLFVGVICIPFTVIYYQTEKWPFGSFFCKLMPTMQVMSVSASISTLTYITFERYQAIVNPLKPRSTLLRLKITVTLIWIWSLIVGIPSFVSYQHNDKLPNYQCREVWGSQLYRQIYTVVLFLVNYAVPLILIFLAYARILHQLQGRSSENMIDSSHTRVLHRRFVKLMLILVSSFAVCYFPSNVMFILLDFDVVIDPNSFQIALSYSHVLVWLSSCLNPFVYGSLDSYFKKGYKRAIGISSHSEKTECLCIRDIQSRCQGKKGPTSENNSSIDTPPPQYQQVVSPGDLDAIFKDYRPTNEDIYRQDYNSNAPYTGTVFRKQSKENTETDQPPVFTVGNPDDRIESGTRPLVQSHSHTHRKFSGCGFINCAGEETGACEDSKEIFISLDASDFSALPDTARTKRRDFGRQDAVSGGSRGTPTNGLDPNCVDHRANHVTPEGGNSAYKDAASCSSYDNLTPRSVLETEAEEEQDPSDFVLYHDKDEYLNTYDQGYVLRRGGKSGSWYDELSTSSRDELGKAIEQMDETTV